MIADNKPKRMGRTVRAAAGVTAAAVFIIAGGVFGATAANADVVTDPAATTAPTDAPTTPPTDPPTAEPTTPPTDAPTTPPTDQPTAEPTTPPTVAPVDSPAATGPINVQPPQVNAGGDGQAQVDFMLGGSYGSWQNSDGSPLALSNVTGQWFRVDGSAETLIGDAATVYVPTAADLGKVIKLVVTATGDDGSTSTAFAESDPVIGYLQATDIQLAPQPKVGVSISPVITGWTVTPDSVNYQWSTFTGSDAQTATLTPIAGATGASFTPTTAELGKNLWVDINGVKTGWLSRNLHMWTPSPVAAADQPGTGGTGGQPGDGGTGSQPGDGGSTDQTAPPTAPFPDDAGFNDANKGNVSGVQNGKWISIDVPGLPDGYKIYVYGFSTPTGLGWYTVSGGKIIVDISKLPAGNHTIALMAADGTLIGHVPATVTAGAASSPASTGTAVLGKTGSSIEGALWGGSIAAGIVLLGVMLKFGPNMVRRIKAARVATAAE